MTAWEDVAAHNESIVKFMKDIYASVAVDTSGPLTTCLSPENCFRSLVYVLIIKDAATGISS